jgi:hypothetical protein
MPNRCPLSPLYREWDRVLLHHTLAGSSGPLTAWAKELERKVRMIEAIQAELTGRRRQLKVLLRQPATSRAKGRVSE